VRHTLLPGTVIVSGGSLWLSPNERAFLGRAASPKSGEGRFVQGNYKGHLSSRGETIRLLDSTGRAVSTLVLTGPAQRHTAIARRCR